MKIPGANKAMVDPAKVRDYLVSPEHSVGRFKAVFFASLGYSRANWPALQAELQRLALSDDAVAGAPSDFGQKFSRCVLTLMGHQGDGRPSWSFGSS